MGLDMYLNKRTFIGNEYKKPKDQVRFKIRGVKQGRVSYIEENVGYWRKANAIHNWFVHNVQDGEDDCQPHYVSKGQLELLLDTVEIVLNNSKLVKGKIINGYAFENGKREPITQEGKIIKDPSFAKEYLPVTTGFFFGSYDYDEYYYQSLLDTKKIVEQCLKEGGDYYYKSSW